MGFMHALFSTFRKHTERHIYGRRTIVYLQETEAGKLMKTV